MMERENNCIYSKINDKYEISEKTWVVSLINTISGIDSLKNGGHAALVAEGLIGNSLYVRHCDLKGKVIKAGVFSDFGYIEEIRIFENYRFGGDYSNCSGWSWYADPENIKKMLLSIEEDKNQVDKNDPSDRIAFDFKRFLIFNWTDAHNCMSWCKEKLEIAQVDISGKDKPKKIDVTPSTCLLS